MSEPNETTHRRVRIAVVVDDEGYLHFAGSNKGDDCDSCLRDYASEHCEIAELHYIEAWLPRPQPIEGESEHAAHPSD